jgi:hypothetical protein
MGIIVNDSLDEVSSDDGLDSDELKKFINKHNYIDSQRKKKQRYHIERTRCVC